MRSSNTHIRDRFVFLSFTLIFLIFTAFPTLAQVPERIDVSITDMNEGEFRSIAESHISSALTTINTSFSAERNPDFSSETAHLAFSTTIDEIWQAQSFYIPDERIIESISRRSDGTFEMRNIPLYLVDKEGEEHYEEGVVSFDADGKLLEFRIGLPKHRFVKLLQQGQDEIDEENRHHILTFVENFRTAYNRKDLDYITNVFSDQALIIVGRVIENTGEESAFEKQVEYLKYSKTEYVERLGRIFAQNNWIDVGFSEIEILRHPKHPEIYGVSLTQYYNSSNYSDEGYLFLLIDFKDRDKPMIHVRTWQPTNSVSSPEMAFSIGDMEIF